MRNSSGKTAVLVSARIRISEREALQNLANEHDRTPSKEISRAIRFYLNHFETVNKILLESAKTNSTKSRDE